MGPASRPCRPREEERGDKQSIQTDAVSAPALVFVGESKASADGGDGPCAPASSGEKRVFEGGAVGLPFSEKATGATEEKHFQAQSLKAEGPTPRSALRRAQELYAFSACERQLLRWAEKAEERLAASRGFESLAERLLYAGGKSESSAQKDKPASPSATDKRSRVPKGIFCAAAADCCRRSPLKEWQKAALKKAIFSRVPSASRHPAPNSPSSNSGQSSSTSGVRRRSKRGMAGDGTAAATLGAEAESSASVLSWEECLEVLRSLQTDEFSIGAVPVFASGFSSAEEALNELRLRVGASAQNSPEGPQPTQPPASPPVGVGPAASLGKKQNSVKQTPSHPPNAAAQVQADKSLPQQTPTCSVRLFFEWLLENQWKTRKPSELREAAEKKYATALFHLQEHQKALEGDNQNNHPNKTGTAETAPAPRESLEAALQVRECRV